MNDANKQAVFSAVRSILIALGSMLVARGYIDDGTAQSMIGAAMVILPLVWGVLDKYLSEQKTKDREVIAVNAGIIVADITDGPTPKATPETAKAIIEVFAPEVQPTKGTQ